MFPVPVPGLGSIGAAGKVKKISKLALEYYEYFLVYFRIFWIIAGILLLAFVGIKIYNAYYRAEFRLVKMFLYRLYTELMLFKNIGELGKDVQVELGVSRKESIRQIKILLNNKTRIKKIGKNNHDRILDGLKLIEENKIKIDDQTVFVKHWIDLIASCLKY